jgi:SAM-dependent methyltransferase
MSSNPGLASVADYYSGKVRTHGATPNGVDWNGAEGQQLRFDMLLKVVSPEMSAPKLDDFGCGYGALLDHLQTTGREAWDYCGIDISPSMIEAARDRHPREADRFVVGERSSRVAEFAVASGIFNVRLDTTLDSWERQIETTLDTLHESTTRGFAFNCLTTYSDPPRRKDYLYYGDPCRYFDLCKRRYSRNIALLHDYGLYEFTLLVRKEQGS